MGAIWNKLREGAFPLVKETLVGKPVLSEWGLCTPFSKCWH